MTQELDADWEEPGRDLPQFFQCKSLELGTCLACWGTLRRPFSYFFNVISVLQAYTLSSTQM